MTVCQRYRLTPEAWRAMPEDDREMLLAWEIRNELELADIVARLTEDEEKHLLTPEGYGAIRLARSGL